MNRATGKTLGASGAVSPDSILCDIPLYWGGPVASDKLILAAWKWNNLEGSLQLYFGIEGDRAEQLLKEEVGYQIIIFPALPLTGDLVNSFFLDSPNFPL